MNGMRRIVAVSVLATFSGCDAAENSTNSSVSTSATESTTTDPVVVSPSATTTVTTSTAATSSMTATSPAPSPTASAPVPSPTTIATPPDQASSGQPTTEDELATSAGASVGVEPTEAAPTAATGESTNASADGESTASGEVFDGKELFILFGQSNMSGFTPMLDEPWSVDENITFMVQYDCARLEQTKDEWLPAEPPLHGCQWATNGLGLGLGDYFGKAMAEAWPTSKIGLIPNAIPAVTIDIFMKGGPAPEGASKALPDGYTSAYTLMIDRAKDAQKLGRIRAILLNQGESDFNKGFGDEWPDRVATVIADLREDLGLGEAVPFVAGEVPPTGNYSGHNVNVHKLPDKIPNCAVVTGEGTDVHDNIHYDQASVKLMGDRYASAVMQLLGEK